MSEDFLSRWSRRKDEARYAARGSTPQPHRAAELAPDAPRQRADDPGTLDAEPAFTPEELAALPKLDELTADSDITGFLRRGVPEGLRNAALRKMWILDPAIRDFVGPARDYAYDWNTPGGVPGNGALEPEHVAALVRRVFGESEAAPSGPSGTEAAEDHAPAVRPTEDGAAAALRKKTPREEGKPTADDSETETGAPSGKGGRAADADA
jgi:hypothetical protein